MPEPDHITGEDIAEAALVRALWLHVRHGDGPLEQGEDKSPRHAQAGLADVLHR